MASFNRPMYSPLFATAFNQFRHCPRALLDSGGLCRGHPDSTMGFAEIVIREIERDRSFEILELFADGVRRRLRAG